MASFIPLGAPPMTYLAPINCAPRSTILPRTHFWSQILLSEPHGLPHRASPTTPTFRHRPTFSTPMPPFCTRGEDPLDLLFLFPHWRQTPVDRSGRAAQVRLAPVVPWPLSIVDSWIATVVVVHGTVHSAHKFSIQKQIINPIKSEILAASPLSFKVIQF
jgi:hypothetical protein